MISPQIYDAISLYDYIATFGLLVLALVLDNMYLLIVLAGALSQEVPVFLSKTFIHHPRPEGAKNCNTLNLGTPSKNGFPSGHTTFSTFIFVYVLYQALHVQKETGSLPWRILLITGLFAALMPVARVQKKCHTFSQVLGGFALGCLWAGLFILIEETYLMNIEVYRRDKKRIFQQLK
jgi:membrane-associated phospholipid phosphatase